MKLKIDIELLTTPSPASVFENGGRDIGADEGVHDEWGRGQTGDKTSPFQSCDIGDDNLR